MKSKNIVVSLNTALNFPICSTNSINNFHNLHSVFYWHCKDKTCAKYHTGTCGDPVQPVRFLLIDHAVVLEFVRQCFMSFVLLIRMFFYLSNFVISAFLALVISVILTSHCLFVVERCICGYLASKPRILVTHQLQHIGEADDLMVLDQVRRLTTNCSIV